MRSGVCTIYGRAFRQVTFFAAVKPRNRKIMKTIKAGGDGDDEGRLL